MHRRQVQVSNHRQGVWLNVRRAALIAAIPTLGVVVGYGIKSREERGPSTGALTATANTQSRLSDHPRLDVAIGLASDAVSDATARVQNVGEFWQKITQTELGALVALAMRNLITGNEPHAVRALEVALTAASTDASTAYTIAELLAAGGRDAGYLHWLAQALARNPQVAQGETSDTSAIKDAYLTVMGATLRTDPASALALSQIVAGELPGDPDITALRAHALLLLGYRQQAVEEMGIAFASQQRGERDAPSSTRHTQTNLAGQQYFEILTQAGDESAAAKVETWLASRRSANEEAAKPALSEPDAGT